MMLVLMVDAAECLCPHVMGSSNLRQELLKAGAARMTIPPSFISSTLLDQSGMDIINKIRCAAVLELSGSVHHAQPSGPSSPSSVSNSEVKLSVASLLSDRILDEILESLSRSQHTLVSVRPSERLSRRTPSLLFVHYCPAPVWVQADHVTRKSQPLVHQEVQTETEVLDEVVLKDQGSEDLEPSMVGLYEPGLGRSLTGMSTHVLVSPSDDS